MKISFFSAERHSYEDELNSSTVGATSVLSGSVHLVVSALQSVTSPSVRPVLSTPVLPVTFASVQPIALTASLTSVEHTVAEKSDWTKSGKETGLVKL